MVSDKWGGPERADDDMDAADQIQVSRPDRDAIQPDQDGWVDPRDWLSPEERSTYYRRHETMPEEEIARLEAENAKHGITYQPGLFEDLDEEEYGAPDRLPARTDRPADDGDGDGDGGKPVRDLGSDRDRGTDGYTDGDGAARTQPGAASGAGSEVGAGAGEWAGADQDPDAGSDPAGHSDGQPSDDSRQAQTRDRDLDQPPPDLEPTPQPGRHAAHLPANAPTSDRPVANLDEDGKPRLNDPVHDGPWLPHRDHIKEQPVRFGDRVLGEKIGKDSLTEAANFLFQKADEVSDVAKDLGTFIEDIENARRSGPTGQAETRADEPTFQQPYATNYGSAAEALVVAGILAGHGYIKIRDTLKSRRGEGDASDG